MKTHLQNVAAHHDSQADMYDRDYFAKFGLYHQITLENIKRYLPRLKDKPILDAGGGTGIWSIELAKLGYRVMLTDISDGMLQEARRKVAGTPLDGKIETKLADICSMPDFTDGQFAMVLCEGDPLSYCGDHQAAIRESVRVLEPGGIFIASVDNRVGALNWFSKDEDLSIIEKLLATGEATIPRADAHRFMVHAFTPEELKNLFQSVGLEVLRLIGKPVFAHRLANYPSDDPDFNQRLLKLELQFCDDPAFYPWGGHLEIVGRKR